MDTPCPVKNTVKTQKKPGLSASLQTIRACKPENYIEKDRISLSDLSVPALLTDTPCPFFAEFFIS